jgi:hypothetical protein
MQILANGASVNSAALDEESGVAVSGKSAFSLVPPHTRRSDFFVPLPEDFREPASSGEVYGAHSETIRGSRSVELRSLEQPSGQRDHFNVFKEPEPEPTYLTDDLPDYQSEESSFCLPDPLQLQEMYGNYSQQDHVHADGESAEIGARNGGPADPNACPRNSSSTSDASRASQLEGDWEESGTATDGSMGSVAGWERRMAARCKPGGRPSAAAPHTQGRGAGDQRSVDMTGHQHQWQGSGSRGGQASGRSGRLLGGGFSLKPPLSVVPEESFERNSMEDSLTHSISASKSWW